MTIDELAGFDGGDGRPAYFAYGGRIFDATESKLWKGGNHLGRHQAGFDLSDALKQAPHGEEKIISLPLVGNLRETAVEPRTPVHLKAFRITSYNVCYTKLLRNQHDIADTYRLAKKIGAHAWYMFMIVPTGRGEEIMSELISKEDYEEILEWHYSYNFV